MPMRDGARLNTFVYLPRHGRTALSGDPAAHALRHHVRRGQGQHRLRAGLAAEPGCADARLDPARLSQHRRARLCGGVPGHARPLRLGGRGSRLCRRRGRRLRHAGLDRRSAVVQRHDRHVRFVGRRHDDVRRGLAAPSEPARVLRAGRRLEHLRRRGVRRQRDRDGAAVAVGREEHPRPVARRIANRSCAASASVPRISIGLPSCG